MKSFVKQKIKSILFGNYLPCYIISREPFIVISYWFDFVNEYERLKTSLPSEVTILFQLGWHVETTERVAEIKRDMELLKSKGFAYEYVFMANSPQESELLLKHGFKSEFCHQNAFLDEKRYPLIRSSKKTHDAVYIARITPFKRHSLSANITSLRLIGDHHQNEEEYFNQTLSLLSHVKWDRKVLASKVYKELSRAHVGLCLSQEEGAMFVSTEYLLCGIPLVSTRSKGGRSELFDDYSCLIVEDSEDAVKMGVEEMKSRDLNPIKVREKVLRGMNVHREKFISIIQKIFDEKGISKKFKEDWPNVFYHKFGLRSSPTREIIKNRMLN